MSNIIQSYCLAKNQALCVFSASIHDLQSILRNIDFMLYDLIASYCFLISNK